MGRGGFHQLLGMPLSSCCRYHPVIVNDRFNQFSIIHAAFTPVLRARPMNCALSRPPVRSLSLRPDDSLTFPKNALSMGFRQSVSLVPAIQATRLLIIAAAGFFILLNIPALTGHTTQQNSIPFEISIICSSGF